MQLYRIVVRVAGGQVNYEATLQKSAEVVE